VTVFLRLQPKATANVTFDGVVYFSGDVIRTEVTQYEALQLVCPTVTCDMTGTLVAGSKPVAVMVLGETGSSASVDGYEYDAEQLPPVSSYG
jgi:hypothetical protein